MNNDAKFECKYIQKVFDFRSGGPGFESHYSSLSNTRTPSNNCIQGYKFGHLLHKNARNCPFFANLDDKINKRTGMRI